MGDEAGVVSQLIKDVRNISSSKRLEDGFDRLNVFVSAHLRSSGRIAAGTSERTSAAPVRPRGHRARTSAEHIAESKCPVTVGTREDRRRYTYYRFGRAPALFP